MFFKTSVFRNFPIFTGKHLCWRHFLIKLSERDLTQVFSCEYCKIFMKSFFDKKPLVAPVDLVFITKSNVGWFLLKRVDLVIVCVINTLLVETIPTHFSLLTCRNQKQLRLLIKNGSHGWRTSCILTASFKRFQEVKFCSIKVALSSLRKSLETESLLKMLKNAFHLKYSSRSHDI